VKKLRVHQEMVKEALDKIDFEIKCIGTALLFADVLTNALDGALFYSLV
jgi:hypothetical protein